MDPAMVSLLVCGLTAREKTVLETGPTPGARFGAEALLQLSGRAVFRKDGTCVVSPVNKLRSGARIVAAGADRETFLFLTGLIVPFRGAVLVRDPAFEPEIAALERETCGLAEFGFPASSCGAAGIESRRAYRIPDGASPSFLAGLMTGSLALPRETDVLFEGFREADALAELAALIPAGGGGLLPLTDGYRVLGRGPASEDGAARRRICG